MQYGVNVRGDYQDVLNKLEASVSESVLRSAGFAGADVFRDEVLVRIPVLTGTLKANVIIKRIEEESTTTRQTYYVMPRTRAMVSYKKGSRVVRHRIGGHAQYEDLGDLYYWRMVEFGTSKMDANPFMRHSFDAKSKRAIQAMEVRLSERLREIIGAQA